MLEIQPSIAEGVQVASCLQSTFGVLVQEASDDIDCPETKLLMQD